MRKVLEKVRKVRKKVWKKFERKVWKKSLKKKFERKVLIKVLGKVLGKVLTFNRMLLILDPLVLFKLFLVFIGNLKKKSKSLIQFDHWWTISED